MKPFKNFFLLGLLLLFITPTTKAQTVYDDEYALNFMDFYSAELIKATEDGGHLFAGTVQFMFANSGLFGNSNSAPLFLAKTDQHGATEWMKIYQSSLEAINYGLISPTSIAESPGGGFVIAGKAYVGSSLEKNFLLKIDAYGNEEWFRMYGCENASDFLIFENCYNWHIKDITITDDEHITAIGTIEFESGKKRALIFQTDEDGFALNVVSYAFQIESSQETGIAIEAVDDGFYVLTESYFPSGNMLFINPLLIKLDHQLQQQWSRLVADEDDYTNNVHLTALDLVITQSEECILMGMRNPALGMDWNQIFLISFDLSGRALWDNTLFYGYDDQNSGFMCPNLGIDQNNELYLSLIQDAQVVHHDPEWAMPFMETILGTGVVKMNAGGAPQWFRFFTSENAFLNICDLTVAQTTNGSTVGFIGHKDNDPNRTWIGRLSTKNGENNCSGENRQIYSTNIRYTPVPCQLAKNNHHLYAESFGILGSGVSYSKVRCGQIEEQQWLQSSNEEFLQSIQQKTINTTLNVGVAPNPSNGQFTLKTALTQDGAIAQVFIFDSMGKLLEQLEIDQSNKEFNLDHLPSGNYTIKVQTAQQLEQHKIIIQN